MSCSSKGRSYRKFYDAIPKIPETLQTVTERGNTSTQSVEFEGDVETQGFFIGDGSQLTNIPPQTSITLETTVTNDNTASRGAYFDGDVEEIEFNVWGQMQIRETEPPEDWSGAMDMMREDFVLDTGMTSHEDWASPLDTLDAMEMNEP